MNTELSKVEQSIQILEQNMDKYEQVECSVSHMFAPGVCIREVHLLAGTHIIGHRHTTTHTNIIVKGKVLLRRADGNGYDELDPCMWVSPPGRKIVVVLEDTVWLNIFPTDSTDVEFIESTFLDKSEAWNDGADKVYSDRALTAPGDLPLGIPYKFKVDRGRVYACGNIKKGEVIAPIRTEGQKTLIYRKIKCTDDGNAAIINGEIVATRPIKGNIGGLRGDEILLTRSYAKKEVES